MVAREVFGKQALICNITGVQGLGSVDLPRGLTWEGFCRARPGASVMEYLMLTGAHSI